jgi:hypothetical protein
MTRPKQIRIWSFGTNPMTAALTVALAFAMTPPALAQAFNVLHSFTGGSDGAYLEGSLAMDSNGNLVVA